MNHQDIQWKGMNPSYFIKYNAPIWQNKDLNENCCGEISAATMLSFYQDHLSSSLHFNASIREYKSRSPEMMITRLKQSTFLPNATIPPTLCIGVNRFLRHYNHGLKCKAFWRLSTWKKAITKIDEGKVVCIGISGFNRFKGVNPYDYGWHWVVAYAYSIIEGQGYYRCIDNWGHHDVMIKASTTIGILYLSI